MFYMPCRHCVLFWPVFIAQSIRVLTHSSVDVTVEGRPLTNLIPDSDVNTNRRQTGGLVVNLWLLKVLLQTGTATPKIPASSRFIKTSVQVMPTKRISRQVCSWRLHLPVPWFVGEVEMWGDTVTRQRKSDRSTAVETHKSATRLTRN